MKRDVCRIVCTIFIAYLIYIYFIVTILISDFYYLNLVVWVLFQHFLDVLLVQNGIILINTVDHSEVVYIYKVEPCL